MLAKLFISFNSTHYLTMLPFKHFFLLLTLPTLLVNVMTSCSTSTPKTQITKSAATDSTLTTETVIHLFSGLEGLGNTPEKVTTESLYDNLIHAQFVPSDGFGDMDSYDEYFSNAIKPMETPDTTYIFGAEVKSIQGDTALATVTIRHIYEGENLDNIYQVTLAYTQEGWKIDDYDFGYGSSIKTSLETFIADQRALYRSEEWVKRVNRAISEKHYIPCVMQTLKEIDEYFEEKPMPNDATDISDEELLDLFHAIPGYWGNDKEWKHDTTLMKESFSASTYHLIEQLFDTPELERDGWPDSFWTKYWILSLPEGCYGNSDDSLWIQGCHAEYRNDSLLATIETVYHYWESQVDEPKGFYYYEPMRLYLVKEDGKWVIEDFYCRPHCTRETYKSVQEALPWMKNCIQAYITEIRKELRSDKWKEENNPDKETDPERLKTLQNYLQHVEDYFQKYPDE